MAKTTDHNRDRYGSLLLYAAVSFIAFFRCLVLGQAYFDNDLLAQFGPWRAFLKDQLAQGHFPLWNPYSMGGQPFFADLQNMMLYPLNYLTLPFPVPYGLSLFFFLHMFLAMAGTHLWLRSLGLSRDSARAGAFLLGLSNFFWLELIHPPVVAAFAWLPWFFWSLELLSQKPKTVNGFGTGFSFAMLFLAGSLQVTVGAFYGGLAYFLGRLLGRKPAWKKSDRKAWLVAGLFCAWGALPLLGQLIPTLEFTLLTDRRAPNLPYEQFVGGLSLVPQSLYEFLLPRFSLQAGRDMAEAVQFAPSPNEPGPPFMGTLGYLGIWAPFLAGLAFRRKDKSLPLFFLFFSLVTLGICMGNFLPLHRLLGSILPGLSLIRVPYRFLFLYTLGISALAAWGFEEWLNLSRKVQPLKKILVGALLYSFVLYLACLFHPAQNWREILALLVGFLAMAVPLLKPSWKKWSAVTFLAALVFPMLLNGWADFIPGPPSNFDFEKNSGHLVDIASQVRPYRLIFDNSHMGYPIEVGGKKYILNYPQNAACALKIKNFGGYNPLVLQAKKDLDPLSLEPLVHLGALKGMVTQVDHGPMPNFKLDLRPPYAWYEYQKPLSYVYAPSNVLVIPDPVKLVQVLAQPDFDVSKTILFSLPPLPGAPPASPAGPVRLNYELLLDEPDQQVFSMDLTGDSWVLFPEVNYPGWKALVDGRLAPIVTADHLFRSLYLSPGNHRVEFRFEPGWLQPIQWGLVLWLLVTAAWLNRLRRQGRGIFA